MKLPSLVRQLLPASAHANMARDPGRAIRGFEQLLTGVKNLPRSLGNEAYQAETHLRLFVSRAKSSVPSKAEFKVALGDVRCITRDMESVERSVCLDQGNSGSSNHQAYFKLISAKKQGIALKNFKAK